ncbi:MAG: hypothetical protein PUE49_06025 [Eggerthellales bacterium]|nr:hypothetical protein [Eggerthellales bacterium]
MASARENRAAFVAALEKYEVQYTLNSFGTELSVGVYPPMSNFRDFYIVAVFREDGLAMDLITSSLPSLGSQMLGGLSLCNSLNASRMTPCFYIDDAGVMCAKAVFYLPGEPDGDQMFAALVNFFNDIDINYPYIMQAAQR